MHRFIQARADAVRLVEDIADLGGLQLGGEQYPNALCAVEAGQELATALALADDVGDAERAACDALADLLVLVWTHGLDERPGGTTIDALEAAVGTLLETLPPLWAAATA